MLHDTRVTAQLAQKFSVGHVPEPNGLILTARGQNCPIGAECHAINRCRMAAEGPQLLAAWIFPKLDGVIKTAAGQELAARTEGKTIDQCVVAFEFGRRLCSGGQTASQVHQGCNTLLNHGCALYNAAFSSAVAAGANPRRIVFSVIVRGTRNCNR